MTSSATESVETKSLPAMELLPKDHTILEQGAMVFRPFGLDEHGQTIRDLSGVSIRAVTVFLEKLVASERGAPAGKEAVEELCRLLNDRIKDPVYHVTPEFLKNPWNSYSYEFTSYLYEFCERISGDRRFAFKAGAEKVSPIMLALTRPFSLSQIYTMFPYFGNKFTSGSVEFRVVEVTSSTAVVAMQFTERTLRQFGPYRRRCACLVCQSAQGIMVAMADRIHGLSQAEAMETSCIGNDDEWCQWTIRWQEDKGHRKRFWRTTSPLEQPRPTLPSEPAPAEITSEHSAHPATTGRVIPPTHAPRHFTWFLWGGLSGIALMAGVGIFNPNVSLGEVLLVGVCPILAVGIIVNRRLLRESERREALIQEQISFVESRHEELRAAYLEQEQMRVELRRKVAQLTALHRAGLSFNSTFERDALLHQVLEALTHELSYNSAMVSMFDPIENTVQHIRVIGAPPEVEAFARSCRIPINDPESPEGMVVLQGRPLLVKDIESIRHSLHPLNQRLAELSKTKALVVVPIKTKDRMWGMLTVDRSHNQSVTEDDLELMTTVASQVSIALDNASAYQQIEEWNAGLELKVRERTEALERADRLRAQFLSHVSHELRTPLTSIKGFIQNLLDGLTGPLNEKQQRYLVRMSENSDRLVRMIEDLLDRTRIETGRLEIHPANVDLEPCLADVIEQLKPLAHVKQQTLEFCCTDSDIVVWADRDRLIQTVVNLVQNAIKFTPAGGSVMVTCELTNHRRATVLVRDTGPGIPPVHLDKIFDPFFRIQEGQRTGPKGLGLGLSIVKTLVELQGGDVTARNRPTGGAELSFTIPIYAVQTPLVLESHLVGRQILVVDDDTDIQQLLHDRLRAGGYLTYSAYDGRQALDTLQTQKFDGMILDIGIGQIDGLEVLRRVRMTNQELPIIMITASGSLELAVKAIGMGAQAYLLKPFDAGELQQAMDRWFQRA
ncbi:MAG: response regulator [Nitrospira sp. BO4]|jgi:signal transduction histidine kinase|nr:response regulator [Nitrospira sp. BO4]